jgi:DNA-binding transcriptional LysR family regulator
MIAKGLTLRSLEVFEALASCGSVAHAAKMTGLSQPAVSQQLSKLEATLATNLIQHNKRPMRLTQVGEIFLTRVKSALAELRLAHTELTVMDLAHLKALSIGLIDDFDNELTPHLATILADSLTGCKFKLITAPSHEISKAIEEKKLHIAISANAGKMMEGVHEYSIARDPFILVAPKDALKKNLDIMALLKDLPLLRYDQDQLISRQIEGHLKRQHLDFPQRFELGSHLSLMAMVARGIGWAITTPLGYMRAERFHDQVIARPLPFKHFSREIILYAGAEWAGQVPTDVAQTMRNLIQHHIIDQALVKLPWLAGELRILEAQPLDRPSIKEQRDLVKSYNS